MDRRRTELQLRLVQAMLRSERRRGDAGSLDRFVDAAVPIVDRVALTIEHEQDGELTALLDSVRAELAGAAGQGSET